MLMPVFVGVAYVTLSYPTGSMYGIFTFIYLVIVDFLR